MSHGSRPLDLGKADHGRLSFVGLSGAFGSIMAGKVWSAFYNHVGAVTDSGVGSTNEAAVSYRSAHTASYAASTGPVNFQLDLVMAPDHKITETESAKDAAPSADYLNDLKTPDSVKGKSLDALQLGLTLSRVRYMRDCPPEDRDELMALCGFPTTHRQSFRASNPIESTFSTVRHWAKRSRGCLRGFGKLGRAMEGYNSLDGIEVEQRRDQAAA